MRENPVIISGLRHVFHIGEYFAPAEDRVPQEFEHGPRHVGMTNDAVRPAEQLCLGVARHPTKRTIGVSDAALQVGLRDDDFVLRVK